MNDAELMVKLKIASPCPARWADMDGDERIRFCGLCQKNVYNFCGVDAAQAVAIIREKEGRLCGRFYQRADGTLLTTDCPVGVMQAWTRLRRLAAAAAALLFFSTLFALSTRATAGSYSSTRNRLYVAWDDAKWMVKGWLGIRRPVLLGEICVPAPSLTTSTNSVSQSR